MGTEVEGAATASVTIEVKGCWHADVKTAILKHLTELDPMGDEQRLNARYNRFQVAFAHRLQDVYGVAVVAGIDGSGAVEPEDYPRYFADAIRASRYFAVHAWM